MKKLLLALFILSSFSSKGTIHTIGVWGGYYQFVPASITIQLGDTLEWEPFAGLLPMMLHTITSDNIPLGAVSFDQVWQMPADTFFQYIPQVAGLYQYVCTPHIPNGMIGEFTVINGANTQTYVPDDNFEQALINLGYDNALDDYVTTANINIVTSLDVNSQNISDLTGIEDFIALEYLLCYNNQLTNLNVSNNPALHHLYCFGNLLTSLDVSNSPCLNWQEPAFNANGGWNTTIDNPNLFCIQVDDVTCWDNNYIWSIDTTYQYYSTNCSGTSLQEYTKNKELLTITNRLGRETNGTKNEFLFYIYDDGTVEKRINIE